MTFRLTNDLIAFFAYSKLLWNSVVGDRRQIEFDFSTTHTYFVSSTLRHSLILHSNFDFKCSGNHPPPLLGHTVSKKRPPHSELDLDLKNSVCSFHPCEEFIRHVSNQRVRSSLLFTQHASTIGEECKTRLDTHRVMRMNSSWASCSDWQWLSWLLRR